MAAPRIALVFEGTRGDSQPYCVAGRALQQAGFEVLLAGAKDSEPLAVELGLPIVCYTRAAIEVWNDPAVVVTYTKNDVVAMGTAVDKIKGQDYPSGLRILAMALRDFKPDLILCGFPVLMDVMCIGNAFGFAYTVLGLQATMISQHVGALGVLPTFPAWTGLNVVAWKMLLRLVYNTSTKTKLPVLEEVLEMPGSSFWPSFSDFLRFGDGRKPAFPMFLAVSPALLGNLPPDFSPLVRPLGPLMLDPSDQKGPAFGGDACSRMEAFLLKGEPPVCIGYGSITCQDATFMTLLSLRALMLTGQRGILLSGWAGMSLEHVAGEKDEEAIRAYCSQNVLFMETAPHGVLYPRCKVIVHHGGAGTLNASLRSGVPTVIVPIFVDQFHHTKLVNERGVGVGLKRMLHTTPTVLAEAINRCINCDHIREKSKDMAKALDAEDGAKKLVEEVGEYIRESVLTGEHAANANAFRARKAASSWSCAACCCWSVRCATQVEEVPPDMCTPAIVGCSAVPDGKTLLTSTIGAESGVGTALAKASS
eukprot:gb/GFBE01072329.1/.p1 GENE.gb/GFBE01072329.1/~~gb/GFBE01072329.1/.p1  ORF type:complete len:535 (+),score=82.80 gb/GFBE01072329.1/:1-1605(+)